MSQPTPPTLRLSDRPGELNTYPCGCWLERDASGQHHLHYCAMHAQAPALREALQELVDALVPEYVAFSMNSTLAEPVNKARTILENLDHV